MYFEARRRQYAFEFAETLFIGRASRKAVVVEAQFRHDFVVDVAPIVRLGSAGDQHRKDEEEKIAKREPTVTHLRPRGSHVRGGRPWKERFSRWCRWRSRSCDG